MRHRNKISQSLFYICDISFVNITVSPGCVRISIAAGPPALAVLHRIKPPPKAHEKARSSHLKAGVFGLLTSALRDGFFFLTSEVCTTLVKIPIVIRHDG